MYGRADHLKRHDAPLSSNDRIALALRAAFLLAVFAPFLLLGIPLLLLAACLPAHASPDDQVYPMNMVLPVWQWQDRSLRRRQSHLSPYTSSVNQYCIETLVHWVSPLPLQQDLSQLGCSSRQDRWVTSCVGRSRQSGCSSNARQPTSRHSRCRRRQCGTSRCDGPGATSSSRAAPATSCPGKLQSGCVRLTVGSTWHLSNTLKAQHQLEYDNSTGF